MKIKTVEDVLKELGVADTPKIYVFNKIDLEPKLIRGRIAARWPEFNPVFVSAEKRIGLGELIEVIEEKI
jgi:GTP-binding protein HflX